MLTEERIADLSLVVMGGRNWGGGKCPLTIISIVPLYMPEKPPTER